MPTLGLMLATCAVFLPALGHDFLINWDDRQYLLENPAVRGFSLEHLKIAFTRNFVGNYAPLHIVSYMLDYVLWGMHPYGFIADNIALHLVNGLLFYALLKRLAGQKVWIFAAALVFLLHPVQVESVVWISQRKNLLAMTFFLCSFYSYIVYRDREPGHGRTAYILSLGAFVLATLAKAVVVVLPLVLVLFDACFTSARRRKGTLTDKLPYCAIALLIGSVAIISHSADVQGGETSYYGGGGYTTFLTMLPVLVRYLRMVVWPAGLCAFYDVPVKTGVDLEVTWAAVVAVLAVAVGFILYRRRRTLFFWYALFFVGLLPVSQIIPIVTLMNDRYLYFPMLGGAAVLAACLLGDGGWAEVCASRRAVASTAVALLLTGTLTAVTIQRINVWQDSATLWADAVAKAPGVPLAHDAYGEGLLQQGRIEEATGQFQIALKLQPDAATPGLTPSIRSALANTRNNLGMALAMKGMVDDAIGQFNLALQLNPEFANAYYNLGNALATKGHLEEALRNFEQAARINPGNPAFQANLALTRSLIRESGRPR